MSAFILDASYTLTWCFSDRATPNTDAALRRMEAHEDSALVPWVWQMEVGNVLVAKLPLATNDHKLLLAAQASEVLTIAP